MRLKFMHSDKPRERDLAKVFCEGARIHGVDAEMEPLCASPCLRDIDVACMVGVKSKRLFNACKMIGVVPIVLDKGYVRTRQVGSRVWEFWRVSVGAHHPTANLMNRAMPSDRFETLGIDIRPWRRSGLQIVIAGSSAKYHDFYNLPDPTQWATEVVKGLRKLTDRPIIYRPKPSWREAVPIPGSFFSVGVENMEQALANAWAMVTHGSNASFEAAIMGIPSIVLGNGIARPISSTSIEDIEELVLAKRERWFNNLAYHQFTEAEFESGEAWEHIRKWIA